MCEIILKHRPVIFRSYFNISIQLLSVYFLNIRVSQLTKRIQDLQKDGDIAQLRMFGTLLP